MKQCLAGPHPPLGVTQARLDGNMSRGRGSTTGLRIQPSASHTVNSQGPSLLGVLLIQLDFYTQGQGLPRPVRRSLVLLKALGLEAWTKMRPIG